MRIKVTKLICALLGLLSTYVLSAQQQVITFPRQQMKLSEAFGVIEKQTGYTIAYNEGIIDIDKSVKTVSGNSLNKALSSILEGTGTEAYIDGKIILIVKKNGRTQSRGIFKGRIFDEKGQPLAGASIIIPGTTIGTTADVDGNYSLNDVSFPNTVEISFLGFETKDINISGKEKMPYDIILVESKNFIQDAVVVGYGVQKKANLTGAVAAVSSEELKDRPVASVGQALQGLIPNLNITQSSGRPGAGSNYNIRGNTSPNGGSPLILVDGVDTYLERINSNDIESISVLKDAASAAIYGSRAAYGVILVTTKSGKYNQAPKVTFDGRYSVSANTASTDFETRGYYSAYIADLFMKSRQGVPYTSYTDADYQRLWERRNDKTENPDRPWVVTEMRNGRLSYVYLANFDWYNYMYDESRPTQDYNINVSGGSKNISYLVSGRYYHQKGLWRVAPDYYDSFNTRAKLDIQIKPWLKLSSNTKFFHDKYFYHGNDVRKAYVHALASFVPVNPDGTAVSHTVLTNSASHYIMDGYNAMLQKGKQWGENKVTEMTQTWALTADITKRLKFNVDFSYKFGYLRNGYRDANVQYSEYPGIIQNESTSSYPDRLQDVVYEQNNYVGNGYLSYDNTFNNVHHVTATAGFNYEARHYKDLTVRRQGLLTEDLSDFNLATGEYDKLTGGISEYALSGIFYRATYDFKSKYLFEADGRYDGSSRFPEGHRWGFFPSFSGAYRISEEPFWISLKPVVNNLKIRVSYGSLGNQNIGYYDYYQNVNTGGTMGYSFDGNTLAGHATVDDPVSTGTWEKVISKDLGVDMGFLKDRLTLTGDVYIRDTKGILTIGKQLPSIYGASEPMVNANDIRTKGWELQIGWKDTFNIGNHPFFYNLGAGLSDFTAKYTKADNPSGLINQPYVGKRLGEIWGFKVDGLFPDDQTAADYASKIDMSQVCVDYFASVNPDNKGVKGGDMKYLDLNGDNVITFGKSTLDDPGDRVKIGNSQPRYGYSFNGGFNYLGIDFSIFFQGIGHQDWYPGADNMHFWGPYARPYESFVGKDFMSKVWTTSNTDAYFPRARGYSALNAGSLYYTNDRYLQNIAYLRLKNLTIGYTFPARLLKKADISNLRLYFSGENLWYVSPFHCKYADPELMAVASNKNGDTYSFYKTFSFGLTLTF